MDVRRQAIQDLLEGCPPVFGQLLKEIDEMKFYVRPEYRRIMQVSR